MKFQTLSERGRAANLKGKAQKKPMSGKKAIRFFYLSMGKRLFLSMLRAY